MISMLPYPKQSFIKHKGSVLLCCLMYLIGISFCASEAQSQPVKPEIRIAVQEDNPVVYIYHTALPPIGHGFNVYRKNSASDTYVQLNAYPVRGVASGPELRALLGTLYDDIQLTTGQSSDDGTLTKLRSDFKTANLLSFIYPEIAESLGRLFIDRTATLDSPATYKIEFVDALDAPTGEVLEQPALLIPQKPDAPAQLRAQNQGNLITLFWRYIPPNENIDDKVIRFEAYRIDPISNQHQQLHEKVILRNNALFEYTLTFEVPTIGQTEQLYVQSVDITGQSSEPSTILRYDAIDLDAPNLVLEVDAKPLSNQRVQVSWRKSNLENRNADLAGFNVYRSDELNNNAAYQKLNKAPLSLNQSVYNDTLGVNQGSQVYYYRVTALDASGNEGALSTAAMALVEDHTAPNAPTGLRAELAETGTVSVSWTSENKPSDFETFIVLRRRLGPHTPAIPARVNQTSLSETTFVDHGEAGQGFYEGATYRYAVLSADQSGNFSEPVELDLKIPDVTAPAAPNGVQSVIESASRIAVFWNPSKSDDVMSYLVYRRESGSSKLKAVPMPAHARRFEDEHVVSGTSYEYWVTAADSAGNESAQSAPHSIRMRDFAPPRSVRNVKLSAQAEGQVALQWEPVSAFDMAGYKVYRSSSLTGVFEPVHEELITENRWQDEAGAPGQCYQILAIDTSGNESRPSQPACARTTNSQ